MGAIINAVAPQCDLVTKFVCSPTNNLGDKGVDRPNKIKPRNSHAYESRNPSKLILIQFSSNFLQVREKYS